MANPVPPQSPIVGPINYEGAYLSPLFSNFGSPQTAPGSLVSVMSANPGVTPQGFQNLGELNLDPESFRMIFEEAVVDLNRQNASSGSSSAASALTDSRQTAQPSSSTEEKAVNIYARTYSTTAVSRAKK